jgi:excisionase family DNA binding protein
MVAKMMVKRPGRRKLVRAKRDASDMVTVEDVAVRLGIGRNQAYEAVQAGKIPALRFGRRWLIPRAAFDRMLAGVLPGTDKLITNI